MNYGTFKDSVQITKADKRRARRPLAEEMYKKHNLRNCVFASRLSIYLFFVRARPGIIGAWSHTRPLFLLRRRRAHNLHKCAAAAYMLSLSPRQHTNFLLLAPFGVLEWRFCRSKLILYKIDQSANHFLSHKPKQVLRLLLLENGLCLYISAAQHSCSWEAKRWRRCDTFSNQRAPLMYARRAKLLH